MNIDGIGCSAERNLCVRWHQHSITSGSFLDPLWKWLWFFRKLRRFSRNLRQHSGSCPQIMVPVKMSAETWKASNQKDCKMWNQTKRLMWKRRPHQGESSARDRSYSRPQDYQRRAHNHWQTKAPSRTAGYDDEQSVKRLVHNEKGKAVLYLKPGLDRIRHQRKLNRRGRHWYL